MKKNYQYNKLNNVAPLPNPLNSASAPPQFPEGRSGFFISPERKRLIPTESRGAESRKKTVLRRAFDGMISGWNMPILPEKVAKFDSNIYVRLYKAIGALSTFYIISGLGLRSYPFYFYIGIILSMPYIIYRIVLVFFIIKQFIYNIKNGKYIVRS